MIQNLFSRLEDPVELLFEPQVSQFLTTLSQDQVIVIIIIKNTNGIIITIIKITVIIITNAIINLLHRQVCDLLLELRALLLSPALPSAR